MWCIHLLLNKLLKLDDERYDGNRFEFLETQSAQFSSSNKDHSRAAVVSNFIQVPHINQQHSWDCGLACVLMVLRARGIRCNIEELVKHCPTKSIWTVDLAYLLQKFSISFMYFTVTLEANPKFSVEAFYKDQLPNDLGRVNMLFQKAREAGIRIECRSVSGNEIADLILSGKYIAIALVDQYKL
ncbi:guanylyl cyclase, partial [Genlisea aurea]